MITAKLRRVDKDGCRVPKLPDLKTGNEYRVDKVLKKDDCNISLNGYQGLYNSIIFDFFEDGKPIDI